MGSFSGLLNNAALMLALCVIYDTLGVSSLASNRSRYWITGVLVGFCGIIVMLNPWSFQPGVFFDTRWVLLSLCGLFFGLFPTTIAVLMTGAFRLYQGGPGGVVGTIVIVVTACVGITWRLWRQRSGTTSPPGLKELYLFGLVVQLAMLSCMMFMPHGMRLTLLKSVAPPILIMYPVVTLLVGAILRAQALRRDTEKELLENRKALSRERGLLRGVINAIPDFIFFKNTSGEYLGCNRAFEEFVGVKEEALVGKTVFDVFTGETATSFNRMDQEMFSTRKTVQYEGWRDFQDGRQVFLDTVKTPFKDLDGDLHGLVGVSRDITGRKLMENNLAAERERLAVTLRSIGDGVITTDVEGGVVMLNTVAERLTGWSQEEACGRRLEEVFPIIDQETRKTYENPASTVISCGRMVELAANTILLARDGSERVIADSGAPIFDTENNIIGVVLVFRDVTNQIKTENELQKIKKLESIGLLAGGIAHDFNNILAAILGNINLALFDPAIADKTRTILHEAEKASIRARDLTQQLLTFARGGEPVTEVTSLEAVIRDSADFVLHGEQVVCRYDFPAELWPVKIDRGQIGQVIQNLVLNASQAMEGGGEISLVCRNVSPDLPAKSETGEFPAFLQPGEYVQVVIQDDGAGVVPGLIDKIFDPYFSTKKEGSGLGLTISHSIVSKHNGHISVDSSPGSGTAVTFYLPATREKMFKKARPEHQNLIAGAARVLVMDDEELVQNVTKNMLQRLGHEVEIAGDGEEALQLYQRALEADRKHDLVIMDLTIPGGIGGKEAVGEILTLDPAARVVVSSGYSNDPIMARYEEYGFCAAIVKPFKLNELSEVLGKVLA